MDCRLPRASGAQFAVLDGFQLTRRPLSDFWQHPVCHLCFSHGRSAMDQMVSDSNCCVDRCASVFDYRLGGIYLALGSVNRFTGFAAICSTSKSDAGTIPDAHSHRSACTEGNTCSYPGVDAVTKSSPYANASSAPPPPPIDSLIG